MFLEKILFLRIFLFVPRKDFVFRKYFACFNFQGKTLFL